MTSNAHETLQRLHKTPIEKLGLSDRVLSLLKWNGIASIWDCIEFYYQDAHDMDVGSGILIALMYDDVKPKMKAQGYWSYVLDAYVWRILKQRATRRSKPIIVRWRDKDQDLYGIPIGHLGLSDTVRAIAREFNIISIGDCIHFYISSFRDSPATFYTAEANAGNIPEKREPYSGGYIFLFKEAKTKLRELGYWPLLESSLPIE